MIQLIMFDDIIAIRNSEPYITGKLAEEKQVKESIVNNTEMQIKLPKGKILWIVKSCLINHKNMII